MSLPMLDEASLDDLYQWLDSLPLSRPRKNITRDFSDGDGSTLSLISGAEDSMSSSASSQRQQQQAVNLFKLQVSPTATTNATDACEDLVPAKLLYTAQQQLLAKEEEFRAIEARCGHLEKLLQLKDDRIQQLTQRLERLAQAVCSQNNVNFNNPTSAPPSPRKNVLNR